MPELLNADRLSLTEVAQRLDVNVSTVWRWVNRGANGRKLASFQIGKRRYVTCEDLNQFLSETYQKGTATVSSESESSQAQAEADHDELDSMLNAK